MSTESTVDCGRRRLIIATAAVGGAGAVAAVVPFVSSMLPSQRAKAAGAPVEYARFTRPNRGYEVLDDHAMTVLVRTTVGVLTAIAVAILVAGVATQNAFGIVGGGLATIMLTTALICMSSVPEKLFNR